MKNLEFYNEYIQYLNWRLEKGEINKGKYSLLKISNSSYDSFLKRLQSDEIFNEKVIKIVLSNNRDSRIDEIINQPKNIEDLFDELGI